MASQSISDTSVLLFSSKDDIPHSKEDVKDNINPGEVLYNMRRPSSAENKLPKNHQQTKLVISTRDGPIATNIEPFIRFNVIKDINAGEGHESIWLDFRTSEVHDFLDVIAGRKHNLRNSEHVELIAKEFKINLKTIDLEYDKLADIIRETIIIDIYRIFPAGKITDLNKSLIYIHHPSANPRIRQCRLPGISLKNTISKDIRERIEKLSKFSQEHVWKRVNDSGIPLKRPNGGSIAIQLMTDAGFNEYWLSFRPMHY